MVAFVEEILETAAAAEAETERLYQEAIQKAADEAVREYDAKLEQVLRPAVRERFRRLVLWTPHGRSEWRSHGRALLKVRCFLFPRDVPEHLSHIGLQADFNSLEGYGTTLQVCNRKIDRTWSSDFITIQMNETAEEQLRAIARLLAPVFKYVNEEHEKAQREQEERARREQALREETEKRHINLNRQEAAYEQAVRKVEELAKAALARLEAERAEFTREHGWPEGKVLTVFKLTWVAAYDAEGGACERTMYVEATAEAQQPPPSAAGGKWFYRIDKDAITPVLLVAPNGYTLEPVEWRGVQDVPCYLWDLRYFGDEVSAEVDWWTADGARQAAIAEGRPQLPDPVAYPTGGLAQLLRGR